MKLIKYFKRKRRICKTRRQLNRGGYIVSHFKCSLTEEAAEIQKKIYDVAIVESVKHRMVLECFGEMGTVNDDFGTNTCTVRVKLSKKK